MKIDDLIERLMSYREDHGDVEVRLMTQSNWPLEHDIHGLASTAEIDKDAGKERSDSEVVVYIVEGCQLGYGNKAAWEAAT